MIKTTFYSDARCGAGKTYWAIQKLACNLGKTILAVDRIEIADQRAKAIKDAAEDAGMAPLVAVIVSEDCNPNVRRSVARRIEDAAVELAGNRHIILVVCHAGLRMADLSGFSGWNLVIDEAISLLDHQTHDTGAMFAWLDANYEIGPEGHDGSHPVRFIGSFSPGEMTRKGSREWAAFHLSVLTGQARVDVSCWSERGRWSAWRLIDPAIHFESFDQITVLADSFAQTETGLLMGMNPGITLVELDELKKRDASRRWRSRSVVIEYFLDDRAVSDGLLNAEDFRPTLKAIGSYLAANTSPDDHLWSCNDDQVRVLRDCGIRGTKTQPVQAGSGEFSHLTAVTFLYSAKPTPEAVALYGRWGVSKDQLIAAREFNAIRQYVMRSNARVPDSDLPIVIRVYDHHQATDLETYLGESYGFSVAIQHVDLGVPALRPKPSAKPSAPPLTLEQKRKRQAGYTAKWRANKPGK